MQAKRTRSRPTPPPAPTTEGTTTTPVVLSFDKSGDACTACHEETGSPVSECIGCSKKVHPSCYPSRDSTRHWACDQCNKMQTKANCILCGQSGDMGIMQCVSADQLAEMRVQMKKGQTTADHEESLVHAFCLRFWQHPQSVPLKEVSKKACSLCDQKQARLQCGHAGCSIAFHPFCALNIVGVMKHDDNGAVVIACQKHSAAAQLAPYAVKREAAAAVAAVSADAPRPVASVKRFTLPTQSTSSSDFIPVASSSTSNGSSLPSSANGRLTFSSAASAAEHQQRATEPAAKSRSKTTAQPEATKPPKKPQPTETLVPVAKATGKSPAAGTAAAAASSGVESAKSTFLKNRAAQESAGLDGAEQRATTTRKSMHGAQDLSVRSHPPKSIAAAANHQPHGASGVRQPAIAVPTASKLLHRSKHVTGAAERSRSSSSDDDAPLLTPKKISSLKKQQQHSRATSPKPDKAKASTSTAHRRVASPSSTESSPALTKKKKEKKKEKKRERSRSTSPAGSEADEERQKHTKKLKKRIRSRSSSPAGDSAEEGRAKKHKKKHGRSRSRSPSPSHLTKKLMRLQKKKKAIAISSEDDADDSEDELDLRLPSEEAAKQRAEAAQEEVDEAIREDNAIPDDNCCVCGLDEDQEFPDHPEDNDKMVGCDGPCGKWYHQACYGIPTVPDGDWMCRPCAAGATAKGAITCVICQSTNWRGFSRVKYDDDTDQASSAKRKKHPAKRSSKAQWAHIACAFWTPEVNFADPATRNPVIDVERIDPAMYQLPCAICPKKKGAKLQCRFKDCAIAFHPLCMLRCPEEYYANAHEEDEDVLVDGEYLRPMKEFYCKFHSKKPFLIRARQELLANGQDTSMLDKEIDDFEKNQFVKPTTELMKATQLVRNPHRTGRAVHVVIEVDPTDQEQRAAVGNKRFSAKKEETDEEEEEEKEESKQEQKEEKNPAAAAAASAGASSDSDTDMTDSTADLTVPTALAHKRRRVVSHGIDEGLEIDDEATEAAAERRRLKKSADAAAGAAGVSVKAEDRPKKKKRSSSPVLASSHPLSTASQEPQIDTSSSTANIDARRNVRDKFLQSFDQKMAFDLEKVMWDKCGGFLGTEYQQKFRDLAFNLKANPQLVRSVKADRITLPQLVSMTNAAMATADLQARRGDEAKENLAERQIASTSVFIKPNGTTTAIDVATGKAVPRDDRDDSEAKEMPPLEPHS